MKEFIYTYKTKNFEFGGITRVYNGFNYLLFQTKTQFKKDFHKKYKGIPITELYEDMKNGYEVYKEELPKVKFATFEI